MKKGLVIILIALMVLSLVSCAADNQGEQTEQFTLKVGFDAEYPPFGYIDDAGAYDGFDLALAEADRLKLEAERLEGRAHAARLLHDTFDRHRTVARQKYVAPFREQIERLGRLVYGPSLEIELDDQLGISSRTLNGVTVGFDQLSTGAREQFALLSRLACASLVSGNGEGAPVVFDDALGWTDPQRLGQMAAAISVAARQCQVIVLTCTPGRFAGVGAASVVRLGSSEAREDPSLTA